jgi:hypothetical protein
MNRHPVGTAWRIEHELTRHYLRTDGGFGSAPLRFIDATPEELARALSRPQESPDETRSFFVNSFHPSLVKSALCDGTLIRASLGVEGPGWFQYLVLTCMIASTSPDVSQSDNFRERLKEELGISTTLMNLTGIPTLWEALRSWCESKRAYGDPYRAIILPDPGHMTQIGYSVRIAFPSRRDLDRMERLFGPSSGSDVASPAAMVKVVRDRLFGPPWSDGFKAAFSDFEDRFSRGQRLLADHPFWHAITRLGRTAVDEKDIPNTHIDLSTDIEGETIFILSSDDPDVIAEFEIGPIDLRHRKRLTREIEIEELVSLLFRSPIKGSLGPLTRCEAEGAIPFEEVNWGVWRASRLPESTKVRLLLRPDIARRHPNIAGRACHWFLSDQIVLDVALDILKSIRARVAGSDVFRTTLVDGIKVGANYLGLPGFLPRISATSECSIDITPSFDASGALSVGERDGSRFQLVSDAPLRGAWTASVTERGVLAADLNLKFVPNASEHDFSTMAIDERHWEPEIEIEETWPPINFFRSPRSAASEDASPATFDLLEALYAGGRTGWAEPDLISLLGRHLGLTNSCVWDALRVIADAGWLEPRLSPSWRARKWFLKAPRLLLTRTENLIVLDGAACETVRRRFTECIQRAGGHVQAKVFAGTWSIPTVVGFVRDRTAITKEMGIPSFSPEIRLPARKQAVSYAESQYTDLSRLVASTWSWKAGRFIKGTSDQASDILVERLEHKGCRSNDVYRISKKNQKPVMLSSRTSAIAYAHRLAERPLFRYDRDSGQMERVAKEGFLPRPIGFYLRLLNLASPGLVREENGNCRFVYPASDDDVDMLTDWLGPIVLRDKRKDSSVHDINLLSLVFRRRLGVIGRRVAQHSWNREG